MSGRSHTRRHCHQESHPPSFFSFIFIRDTVTTFESNQPTTLKHRFMNIYIQWKNSHTCRSSSPYLTAFYPPPAVSIYQPGCFILMPVSPSLIFGNNILFIHSFTFTSSTFGARVRVFPLFSL